MSESIYWLRGQVGQFLAFFWLIYDVAKVTSFKVAHILVKTMKKSIGDKNWPLPEIRVAMEVRRDGTEG
jgi:hypothetical protein